MVVNIVRVENGFVKYRDTFPGGPAVYFADTTQPLYLIKSTIFTLQTMVADGALVGLIFCLITMFLAYRYVTFAQKIYRCYVVWQSIWIIVLPSMLWCISAGQLNYAQEVMYSDVTF